MTKTFILILILLGVAGLVWLTVAQFGGPTAPPAKPIVGASIFAIADIVRQVAGDTVTVVQIIPSSASPHTFEVTPSTITQLQGAELIFAVGRGLDGYINDIGATVSTAEIVTVDRLVAIRPLAFGDEDEGETAGAPDPHYWLSPENGKQIASTIALELAGRYPANAPLFESNLQSFNRAVDEAAAYAREQLEPLTNRSIILFHESIGYFTDAFDIVIAGVFEPTPGKEPTPQQLAELHQTVGENNVKAVFSEPQLPDAVVKSFVQDLPVKTGVVDPYGGGAGRNSYQALLRYNAETLAAVLR